jgi:hypothetical protein
MAWREWDKEEAHRFECIPRGKGLPNNRKAMVSKGQKSLETKPRAKKNKKNGQRSETGQRKECCLGLCSAAVRISQKRV